MHDKPDKPYEGWTNSRTYLVAMYMRNESVIVDMIVAALKQSQLTERALKAMVEIQYAKANDENGGGIYRLKEGSWGGAKKDRLVLKLDSWAEGEINWHELVVNFTRDYQIVPEPVTNELQRLLTEACIEGNVVTFPRKLDPKAYAMFNNAMEAIGGKWTRKVGGHVFAEDPTDQIESIIETGTYEKPKAENYGFFRTSEEMAEDVVKLANFEDWMDGCEPSAGDGRIADCMAKIIGRNRVTTIELQQCNADALIAKGYNPHVMDFLTFTSDRLWHRIVMNPPFARQQDIDHVMHAWKFLAPGGRLVAIMAASVTFRENNKTREFRSFVEDLGGIIKENPAGSFKSSGTMVRTVTVVIDKPGVCTPDSVISRQPEAVNEVVIEAEDVDRVVLSQLVSKQSTFDLLELF